MVGIVHVHVLGCLPLMPLPVSLLLLLLLLLLLCVEDEAVVAELLRSYGGALELVDARTFLPLFRARPGLQHWHVLDDFSAIKRHVRGGGGERGDLENFVM